MLKTITHSIELLNTSKIILYPTDTVWGIGCDATDKVAVQKVYDLKQREDSKSLIILVDGFEMLSHYVESIPIQVIEFLQDTNVPITVIYDNPINLAENVIATDNTIAIRIVKDSFCNTLIKQFGKPIVSTSANISKKKTPLNYTEIEKKITTKVDYIIPLFDIATNNKPSKIIKFKNDEIIILRP